MKTSRTIILLIIITLLGFILRFYNITANPASLNIDEVAYGYSAYSILKTAREENGVFMPLSFQSTGDYKNPVLIYSLVPTIAVFGLNEFAVRFTTVLAGILTIPAFFLLSAFFIKDKKTRLAAIVLLAISPWHIYYSRLASESLMALFIFSLGIYAFFRMLKGSMVWALISSFLLILSMYTYHSQRLFVPLLIFSLLILKWRIINSKIKRVFIISASLLVLPLIYDSIFGGASSRAAMVFLSQDIDYTRYVIIDHINRIGEIFLLLFFWIKRYLNYFQPEFLFFNGLNMTTPGILGLGVLYLFELPWLILGLLSLIQGRLFNSKLLILWLLLGLIPASLTNNEQSSLRSLIVLPVFIILIATGAIRFFSFILGIKNTFIKLALNGFYIFFISVFLIQALLIFAVHFPKQRGEAFMEGTKESVLYALSNKEKYNEIVFDPYRGVEAPYIVNIPYMYILFYSKYDPYVYQNENKRYGSDLFGFDKFTIRPVDWRLDRSKTGTLFIGSPWSLPLQDVKEENILKRIYLSNGELALLIVSP